MTSQASGVQTHKFRPPVLGFSAMATISVLKLPPPLTVLCDFSSWLHWFWLVLSLFFQGHGPLRVITTTLCFLCVPRRGLSHASDQIFQLSDGQHRMIACAFQNPTASSRTGQRFPLAAQSPCLGIISNATISLHTHAHTHTQTFTDFPLPLLSVSASVGHSRLRDVTSRLSGCVSTHLPICFLTPW